ncbi:MAG: hypothetical protein ACD_19C00426G0125 [uncultured bacterium]|nr:MAG: hypothetical protein ACD_19C00426G0125 [uncultured bacterium]
MSRIKNQKSFKFDGWKRVPCKNCGRIVGETHLGEKNTRLAKCEECKNYQLIAPPRFGVLNNIKGWFWYEPNDSCFTAIVD